ncbi:hypothetical protein PMAYCL1PPCAC_02838 [Pristionchus mayeri]|uniref:Uncharacterized protein n=1 Tax=Pristionchus mayeri TaxID=1317129 RepID=A0AAN5C0V2_9BILA|nr:hypothetical protein PMAYCL1PPCAC_02838 [Pristionchus mayeri]
MRSLPLLLLPLLPLIAAEQKLRFVQIWFRHGERTPTNYLSFPNDPPIDMDKLPSNKGELTQKGINQEYTLGQMLREEYGDFLGEYSSDKIVAHAGEDNRTIVSGQAMLAGLLPPKNRVIADLPWQPIPIHSRGNLDEVSFGIFDRCEGLEKEIKANPRYQEIMDSIDPPLLELLRNKTGLPIEDPYMYQNVLDSIKTKFNMNSSDLPLPEWVLPIIPSISNLSTTVHTQMTKILNESSGGFHAELLLSNIEDALLLPSRKAFFLSGHDTNLFVFGMFFQSKDLTENLCQYAAHLAIEVYEDTSVPATPDSITIKFFYASNLTAPREEILMPLCGDPCTLGRMQRITEGKRWSERRWRNFCEKGEDRVDENQAIGNGVLTGSLLIAVAVLVLTSILLLYLTCSYRKQLVALRDPEQRPLIS